MDIKIKINKFILRVTPNRNINIFGNIKIKCNKYIGKINIDEANNYIAEELNKYDSKIGEYKEYILNDGKIEKRFSIFMETLQRLQSDKLTDYTIYKSTTDSEFKSLWTRKFLGMISLQALSTIKESEAENLFKGIDSDVVEIANCLVSMADETYTTLFKRDVKRPPGLIVSKPNINDKEVESSSNSSPFIKSKAFTDSEE